MRPPNDLFEHVLHRIARLIVRCPWLTVGLYLALATLASVVAALWLDFETDQNALVSNDLDYNRRYLRYLEEFGDQEFIYVVIDEAERSTAIRVASTLVERLEPLRLEGVIESVACRVDVDSMARSGLVFLPRELLAQADHSLTGHAETLRRFFALDGIDSALRFSLDHLEADAAQTNPLLAQFGFRALQSTVSSLRDVLEGDSLLPGKVDWHGVLSGLVGSDDFRSALAETLPGRTLDPELIGQFTSQGYFFAGDLLFVLVMPSKDYTTLEVIREPLGKVRQAVRDVRDRFSQELGRKVHMGVTGRPVLQADEMQTTNEDMTRAVVIAIFGILVLFMVFFRAVRRPILIAVALVLSIALTFGFATITVGHLNLLSLVFAIMLVSLGTEFGVHIIARYQEELAGGRDIEGAVTSSLLTAGKGNITGATTTAAAFYTTLFVNFTGLSELGFIAGSGVLVCMVTMNTFLPALLVLTDRWSLPRGKLAPLRVAPLFVGARAPIATLVISVTLLVAGFPLVRNVFFNSNLLDLQAEGLPSVEFEKLIIDKSEESTWYAAYLTRSLEEVRRIVTELEQQENADVIGRVESVFDYVPEDQAEKIALISSIGAKLGAPDFGQSPSWPPIATVDATRLRVTLEDLLERLDGFLSGTILGDGEGTEELESLTDSLDLLIESFDKDPRQAEAKLNAWQNAWISWLRGSARDLFTLLDPLPVNLGVLDPFIRDRVVSPRTGSYLVYAYPAADIWEENSMERFITATRAVSAEVTGVPEQVFESTRIMKRGFLLAAIYSMIAVFVLILFDVRNLLFTTLAMIPVLIGLLMTVELMPLFGMSFNLANFFAIPIIIGGGINGGVHMIHRFREDRSAAIVARSTGTAVVLSQLSNVLGFGMMLLAHHRGVASLGGMVVLGFSGCLFVSLAVLPAVLKLVEGRRYRV